jgi:type II secretory ATPase GspE/PulE/Tfp pilus assembly ATPase PilB-like protein
VSRSTWKAPATAPLRATEDASPAVRRLAAIFGEALDAGASDLHLEPDHDGLRVRIRVDGELRDLEPPPASVVPALLTRIRLLARVDLAERRLPQDGRFHWQLDAGRGIDVRAAFLPVARGEKIALRLLPPHASAPSIDELGLPPPEQRRLRACLAKPNGLLLVVGPTGSGKSTTLHAALASLRRSTRSLATVEDPVEFDIPGVSQVAVDEEVGRSFAVVLRALLRQDPDVLMIGEIRDDESARIACRAALTGHLVMSSLHASHSREALLRLPEIGVPDYLVRATVSLVLAQRLVRRLCDRCAAAGEPRADAAPWFVRAGVELPGQVRTSGGCGHCHGSGYRGRLALFEAAGSLEDAPEPFAPGSLGANGLAQAAAGATTIEEVLANCPHPSDAEARRCR